MDKGYRSCEAKYLPITLRAFDRLSWVGTPVRPTGDKTLIGQIKRHSHKMNDLIHEPIPRRQYCCRGYFLSGFATFSAITRTLLRLRPQALSRLSAARLRNWTRREVSSAITPDCTNWVKVRDTVSMVNPR